MEIEVAWYAFAVIILSIVIDFSRSRALNRVAKETHSQALEADALHFSSDILSSFVVLFGLILVAFGIKGGDALAAIGVSIFVGVAGFKLGQRTIDVLVDAAPEGLTQKITAAPTEAPQETIWQEAAKHNSKSDCWIVYGNHIYNITSYFGSHPGGDAVMDKYCGKDATTAFDTQDKNPPSPHSANAAGILSRFLVK